MSSTTVKRGDTEVKWRLNMDLTGSTIRVLAVRNGSDLAPNILASNIVDPAGGVVACTVSGLAVGTYRVEVEVTQLGKIVTFPSDGYGTLRIQPDLG